VLDNHVIAMQSSALRILDLEKHLNWLLTGGQIWQPPIVQDANEEVETSQESANANVLQESLPTIKGMMDPENYVGLSDHVPVETKAAFSDAKGLKISSPIQFKPVTGSSKTSGKDRRAEDESKTLLVKPGGPGWEAIKHFSENPLICQQSSRHRKFWSPIVLRWSFF